MKNLFVKNKLMVTAAILFSMGVSSLPAQTVGEPAGDFEVNLLGGGTFKLSDQLGNVVFVYMFGNTCGPCKAIAPTVEASIYQEFIGHEEFTAVGLDVWDHSSDNASVSNFKSATGVTFPLALTAGTVATAYGMAHDRVMVIDRSGILVHKGQIPVSNDLNNAKEAINQSLTATGLRETGSGISALKVFPVPANDLVHFEARTNISGIRLFDATGQLVLEEFYGTGISSGTRTISVETFDQGVYFYTLQTLETRISGKILIQR
jgi:peroxiredoxin